jgi:hypothetical protein
MQKVNADVITTVAASVTSPLMRIRSHALSRDTASNVHLTAPARALSSRTTQVFAPRQVLR